MRALTLLCLLLPGALVPSPRLAAQELDRKGIDHCLEAFVKAMGRHRSRELLATVDLPRFDLAMRAAALRIGMEPTEKEGSSDFLSRAERLFPTVIQIWQARKGWKWTGQSVIRAVATKGGREARVAVRLQTAKKPLKLSVHLVKKHGRWLVYDWTVIETGLALSEFGAALLVPGIYTDAERRQQLQATVGFIEHGSWFCLVQSEQDPGMKDFLGQLRLMNPPKRLAALVDLVEARMHLQGKDTRKAQAALDRIAESGEAIPEAFRLKCQIALEAERMDEALKWSRRFTETFGPDVPTLETLGAVALERKRPADAFDAFSQLLAADPRNLELCERVLGLAVTTGKLDTAGALLAPVIAAARNPSAPLHLARRHLAGDGALEALLEVAEACRKRWPRDARARATAALALRRLGKGDAAAKTLATDVPAPGDPGYLAFQEQLALNALARGNRREALAAAHEVAVRDAHGGFERLLKALLRARSGSATRARSAILLALKTEPAYARILAQEPCLEKTRNAFARLIDYGREAREFEDAFTALGANAKWEDALAAAEARLAKRKTDTAAYLAKGIALEVLERDNDALACYRAGLSKCVRDARPLFEKRVALALAATGDHDAARKAADALVESRPEDARTLLVRATVWARAGRDGPAVTDLEAALAKNPDIAPAALAAPAFAPLRALDPALQRLQEAAGVEPAK